MFTRKLHSFLYKDGENDYFLQSKNVSKLTARLYHNLWRKKIVYKTLFSWSNSNCVQPMCYEI